MTRDNEHASAQLQSTYIEFNPYFIILLGNGGHRAARNAILVDEVDVHYAAGRNDYRLPICARLQPVLVAVLM